jgi:Zn-dependent protease with chaperone function
MPYKLFLIALFYPILGISQFAYDYQPLQSDKSLIYPILYEIEQKKIEDLEKTPRENRSYLKESYLYRIDRLINDLKEERFIFNTEINHNIDKIFSEICNSNQSIQKNKIRILLSRDSTPNAYCVGEGTIIINLGLFRFLENESQLAFVLCHEIAHFQKNHVNIASQKYINELNSKATKSTFEKIEKEIYNQKTKAEPIFKKIAFNNRQYSRFQEFEADSLGMVYFNKSIFQKEEAIKCLEIFDNVDNEKYPAVFDLKKILLLPESFAQKESNNSLSDLIEFKKEKIKNELLADSLKTHPDCQNRIKKLQKDFLLKDKNSRQVLTVQSFDLMKKIVEFEVVESDFLVEEYGRSIYRILGLLEKYPDNSYLSGKLGWCFFKIYESKKNHTLYKYVDSQNDAFVDNYNQVLIFLNELTLRELITLNYRFLKEKDLKTPNNEFLIFSRYLSCQMTQNESERKQLKDLYLLKFPNGKFSPFFL